MLQQPGATRFLPHAVLATLTVVVVPAAAVSLVAASARPWQVFASVLLAMACSIAVASIGSALWARRPDASDILFADLMLWGWLRRVRAERRLAQAEGVLDADADEAGVARLDRRRRCRVLQRLAAELEAKDAYTLGHSRRVTRHCENIARELGLPSDEIARVRIAASVHDVGKARVPRAVLTKPGRLTEEEFTVVKRHAIEGAEMVTGLGDPGITAMVRHHHERLDGSGYPDGLRGDEIPLGARIIAVGDTFDALTSHRPYQPSQSHRRALEMISEEAGKRLDREAVDAFVRYYSGKKGVALSALGLVAEARVASWAGAFGGAAGSSVPQSVAGVLAAALAGVSLAGEPSAAGAAVERAQARDAATAVTRADAASPRPSPPPADADRSGRRAEVVRGEVVRGPRAERAPNQSPPGEVGGGGSTPEPPPSSPTPAPAPEPVIEPPAIEPPAVKVPDVRLPEIAVPELQSPELEPVELSVDVPVVQAPPVNVELGPLRVELPG